VSAESPARDAGPAIQVDGVTKRYGDRAVLDGVSLSVAPREVVALLGPNGAGKTTLVEIVEGYRSADAGRVTVLGQAVDRGGSGLRARVGLMLQSGGVDPRSTPLDVLRLYRAFHADGREPEGLLAQVGLARAARTRVRRLSGGERQRLALALALVGDPEVLILDEPTAGMDPEARREARTLVASLRDAGRAILLTTHDLGDVEHLADRVAILHRGRIVADASPDELIAGSASLLAFRLHAAPEPSAIERLERVLAGVAATADLTPGASAGAFTIGGAGPTADLTAAVAQWAVREGTLIVELRAGAASLEERYLELTGDRDVESVE